MGYDVTFHPFKRSEYKFYVEEVVENPNDFHKKLKTIHTDNEERDFLKEIFKKEKRTEDDFSEVLSLINKYKAVEESLKRAEYFVNVSRDALAIFPNSREKNILQNLTGFSLNRSF